LPLKHLHNNGCEKNIYSAYTSNFNFIYDKDKWRILVHFEQALAVFMIIFYCSDEKYLSSILGLTQWEINFSVDVGAKTTGILNQTNEILPSITLSLSINGRCFYQLCSRNGFRRSTPNKKTAPSKNNKNKQKKKPNKK
jgi:hypothetical protein